MIVVRKEDNNDFEAIHKLNKAAFENGPEAILVDKLRLSCKDFYSFVAVEDNEVVGHILFTPVIIDDCSTIGMGLAPMSVMPSHQKRGIGSQLVTYGLETLRKIGYPFVNVLGHPKYYPRFGFELASKYKLVSQWEGVPDEAFMIIVFDKAAMPKNGGVLRYMDEFNDAMQT